MRKVNLNLNEQMKYDVIKSLVDHDGNKKAAALKLGCTERHINRLIKGYKEKGKAYFVHGNRGRLPVNKLSQEDKELIVRLYREKFYGATYTHFSELLSKHEGIQISKSTARTILMEEGILSPKSTRKTRKRMKKRLKQELENSPGKRATEELLP